jgi:AcrR family transcriptional regulator
MGTLPTYARGGLTVQQRPRRADATLNRQRILDAARAAFEAAGAETSMAEVARRSGVGSATLYRNFPTRQALLEALLFDELDDLCAEAATLGLVPWLRRLFVYVTTERPVALDLLVLEDPDTTTLVSETRGRLFAAGGPLLTAAQQARAVRKELDLAQLIDLVMAIAKIPGPPQYKQPILDAALDGLRPPR